MVNDRHIDDILNIFEKSNLSNRHFNIISKCMDALKNEYYELFIPVMFAQLEGIIIDVFENTKSTYQIEDFKNLITELTNKRDNNFNDYAKIFYVDFLLSKFEIGKKPKSLSRHAILHGYSVDYGNKENAYKLLFYFEHICRNLYQSSVEVESH